MLLFNRKPALQRSESNSAASGASKEKFDDDKEIAVVDEKDASSSVDELDDKIIEKNEDVALQVCALALLLSNRRSKSCH